MKKTILFLFVLLYYCASAQTIEPIDANKLQKQRKNNVCLYFGTLHHLATISAKIAVNQNELFEMLKNTPRVGFLIGVSKVQNLSQRKLIFAMDAYLRYYRDVVLYSNFKHPLEDIRTHHRDIFLGLNFNLVKPVSKDNTLSLQGSFCTEFNAKPTKTSEYTLYIDGNLEKRSYLTFFNPIRLSVKGQVSKLFYLKNYDRYCKLGVGIDYPLAIVPAQINYKQSFLQTSIGYVF